ncbi:hypothetical protein HanXRQr2_Chr17g0790531 [Helianthus annuus]|uniref:Uncharacterized protein n=1 Tax=Helianthus annuus TaxID=4232 RepID=A0A9K3DHW7_HELAN|nr:hypothetical protein HanXRQr2_Chr17g0790531 [Helianthus annuus]KAJ0432341.1 hypothetical protein HanIR_Chr17g0858131 [Helianthus annuus]KAJ0432344.1 hypothetical protein HanIR_Chr17g0858161 [Helianthus annuus]
MAIISGFFTCFSGSNKVVDDGNEKISKVQKKSDGTGNGRKGAPIPVAYFPIGSNFSRL